MIYWKDLLKYLERFENGITIGRLIKICKREKNWDSRDVSSCLRFLGKMNMIQVNNFKVKLFKPAISY